MSASRAIRRCDGSSIRHGLTPGFTSRYGVHRLVNIEQHDLLTSAIQREKNSKKYPRKWKLNLIEGVNPNWDDLGSWLLDVPAR